VQPHRKHDLRGRGLGQGHLVGVVERKVHERETGRCLHFRVVLVPVHRADDAHVRFGCHERHHVGVAFTLLLRSLSEE
jgi:hypothetical protein